MLSKVNKEQELYEPMRLWLEGYLKHKFPSYEVFAVDSHSRNLDIYLEELSVIDNYPQVVGLDIQIDVLGVIKKGSKSHLIFVEAKKTQLNLHHLGQLWAYCKLCDPLEAFLLSPSGLGGLNKIFLNLKRFDLLNFGDGKKIKQMQVGKWDIIKKAVDMATLIPKL